MQFLKDDVQTVNIFLIDHTVVLIYGHPNEQLFSKSWSFSHSNLTKSDKSSK